MNDGNERILMVGVGLIGGWMGVWIKKEYGYKKIVGQDVWKEEMVGGRKVGMIDLGGD